MGSSQSRSLRSPSVPSYGTAGSAVETESLSPSEKTPLATYAVHVLPVTARSAKARARRVRPIEGIVNELSLLSADAMGFMLTYSRLTVTTEAGRRMAVPMLRAILQRIELANAGFINSCTNKTIDPCVYIMAVKMLVALWNELARKYPHTLGELDVPTPVFDSAQVAHWCKYKTEHAHHDMQFRQMVEIVSRINDCRSASEYEMLMHPDHFSVRRMLVREMKQTHALQEVHLANLSATGETRVDIDFHTMLEKLTHDGIDMALSVNLNEILTHGDALADPRASPVLSLPLANSGTASAATTANVNNKISITLSPTHRRTVSQAAFAFNHQSRSGPAPRQTKSQPNLNVAIPTSAADDNEAPSAQRAKALVAESSASSLSTATSGDTHVNVVVRAEEVKS